MAVIIALPAKNREAHAFQTSGHKFIPDVWQEKITERFYKATFVATSTPTSPDRIKIRTSKWPS